MATQYDADVIVVGAGAMGCNAAWHLHQRGCRVLVLDAASRPASQSTQAAAGFVGCLSGVHKPTWGRELAEIQTYGIQFYTALAERCGKDIGFGKVGIAYIFLTDDGWSAHQQGIEMSRQFGTSLEVLTRDRAAEVLPFIDFSRTKGIVYLADGVRIRAGDAIECLSEELQSEGVTFTFETPVMDFLLDGGRVVGVRSRDGDYRAKNVLVSAGAWSRPLLAQLGISCPAAPCVETRFVTRSMTGVTADMPMLIFRDWQRFYIREERGGLLIGGGNHLPDEPDRFVDVNHPPRVEQIPPGQAYRIHHLLREIEPVMPMLKDVEIDKVASGLPTFTEDQLFIMGSSPRFPSLFVMAGCQEAGVNHGPGFGLMMAELITEGRSRWDPMPYRLDRFTSPAI